LWLYFSKALKFQLRCCLEEISECKAVQKGGLADLLSQFGADVDVELDFLHCGGVGSVALGWGMSRLPIPTGYYL